jgi:predicted nucleotidyltransferase
MVKSLLQARYPGAGVHLFGSVANGLSVRNNNDIDVCLELQGVEDQVGGLA